MKAKDIIISANLKNETELNTKGIYLIEKSVFIKWNYYTDHSNRFSVCMCIMPIDNIL